MSILIKDVSLDGATTDIYIEGKYIREIGEHLSFAADEIIDGRRKQAIPGFVNTHGHAAMTLFRGFGDDMPLMPWLKERIWPNEAKLTHEDMYWGTKLACLEMIKSGTTTFFDMYLDYHATAEAVEEMGIRVNNSAPCFDWHKPEQTEKTKLLIEKLYREKERYNDRISFSIGPHAIYTVSGKLLQWVDDFAGEHDVLIQMHLAETEEEVQNSIRDFGYTPVRYLHHLGVLSSRLLIAHGIHVDKEEIKMLADAGVAVAHNPASNMKLASGMKFMFDEMREAGVRVGLGTDGCASSNNLDMIEAMKLASLLGTVWRKDPEAVSAEDIFQSATADGAAIARLKAGRIEKGFLADLSLVDLNLPEFVPNFNFVSNLVYSANGSCIDTVICDGKVLMRGRKVAGEDEIMERTAQIAYDLVKR